MSDNYGYSPDQEAAGCADIASGCFVFVLSIVAIACATIYMVNHR